METTSLESLAGESIKDHSFSLIQLSTGHWAGAAGNAVLVSEVFRDN